MGWALAQVKATGTKLKVTPFPMLDAPGAPHWFIFIGPHTAAQYFSMTLDRHGLSTLAPTVESSSFHQVGQFLGLETLFGLQMAGIQCIAKVLASFKGKAK
jgi:hypothetical protein